MSTDLEVKTERDADGKLHIRIEATGETAQEIRDAVDYVNSRREQSPPKDGDDGK
jgi:hypothetical protein